MNYASLQLEQTSVNKSLVTTPSRTRIRWLLVLDLTEALALCKKWWCKLLPFRSAKYMAFAMVCKSLA